MDSPEIQQGEAVLVSSTATPQAASPPRRREREITLRALEILLAIAEKPAYSIDIRTQAAIAIVQHGPRP